ncbi:MAG: VWA domain-containing protein [bacterium]|nr:VWA domain-containing protein [bacterium]
MDNQSQIKKGSRLTIIFSLLALLCLPALSIGFRDQTQSTKKETELEKPLEYEVSTRAQLVPLFVVDKKGNPVYDLEQEDIRLYVNGKLTRIIAFNRFSLEETQRQKGKKRRPPQSQAASVAAKLPERINFMIIDTLISNLKTLGPSRAIAAQIIRQASPSDAFVILQGSQRFGLRYIAGPEKNKKKLLNILRGLKHNYQRRNMGHNQMRGLAGTSGGSGDERTVLENLARAWTKRQTEQYQKDVRRFAYSLKQLKYALRSTTLSKSVFLISARVTDTQRLFPTPIDPETVEPGGLIVSTTAKATIDTIAENPLTYYGLLEDSAKAVNYGGGLFYLVNPIVSKRNFSNNSLKFMADAAGGKFIYGDNIKDIANKVKKNTSAYYELAFTPTSKPGKRNRVKVKCLRKGLRLTTIAHYEQERPYRLMKKLEKRMFVLNVVNNGSWSRMTAPVKLVKYKLLKHSKKDPLNSFIDIRLTLPENMRERIVHLYQIDIDPTTRKAAFRFVEKKMEKKEKIRFKVNPGMQQYFVLIEPSTTTCLYNRVI